MEVIYFKCDSIVECIEKWIYSEELKNIVSSFGGRIPTNSLKETVDYLLDFSDIWDYRKKQVSIDKKTKEAARWLISDKDITKKQEDFINNSIEKLGLANVNYPAFKEYDYVVVLGGARMSCLLRTMWANELLAEKGIKTKAIVMLSGFRSVLDSERNATDIYALNAQTEFDLINAGLEKTFKIESKYKENRYDAENTNNSWAIRTYKGTTKIISLAAPSSLPNERRANSADTFEFFYKNQKIKKGSKILFITSEIYVPYQQLEAIRMLTLPYNLTVETVGYPADIFSDMSGKRNSANYLQEIRSTIQSISRILDSNIEMMPK